MLISKPLKYATKGCNVIFNNHNIFCKYSLPFVKESVKFCFYKYKRNFIMLHQIKHLIMFNTYTVHGLFKKTRKANYFCPF